MKPYKIREYDANFPDKYPDYDDVDSFLSKDFS
jgi:hypothetical protein